MGRPPLPRCRDAVPEEHLRPIRTGCAALFGAGLPLCAGPTALAAGPPAGDSPGFRPRVTPSTVAPGAEVRLSAAGCAEEPEVSSRIFDSVVVPPGEKVTTTVDREAGRGAAYEVTFDCGGRAARGAPDGGGRWGSFVQLGTPGPRQGGACRDGRRQPRRFRPRSPGARRGAGRGRPRGRLPAHAATGEGRHRVLSAAGPAPVRGRGRFRRPAGPSPRHVRAATAGRPRSPPRRPVHHRPSCPRRPRPVRWSLRFRRAPRRGRR